MLCPTPDGLSPHGTEQGHCQSWTHIFLCHRERGQFLPTRPSQKNGDWQLLSCDFLESVIVVKCSDCSSLAHGPLSAVMGSRSVTSRVGVGGGHRLDNASSHFAAQLSYTLLPIHKISKMSLLKIKPHTSFLLGDKQEPIEDPTALDLNVLLLTLQGIGVPPAHHYVPVMGEGLHNNKNCYFKAGKGKRR